MTTLAYKKAILNFYNSEKNKNGEYASVIILDAGFVEGTSLYDVRYAHLVDAPKSMSAYIQSAARSARRCRSNNIPFTKGKGHVLEMFLYESSFHHFQDEWGFKSVHEYLQKLDTEGTTTQKLIQHFTHLSMKIAVDYKLNQNILEFSIPNFNYANDQVAKYFRFETKQDQEEYQQSNKLAKNIQKRFINKHYVQPMGYLRKVPEKEVNLKFFKDFEKQQFKGTNIIEYKILNYLEHKVPKFTCLKKLVWRCKKVCRGCKKNREIVFDNQIDNNLRKFFEHVKSKKNSDTVIQGTIVSLQHIKCDADPSKKQPAHANILIIDHQHKHVELHEPHGSAPSYYNKTNFIELLKRGINKHYSDYKLVPPAAICPAAVGPQTLENSDRLSIALFGDPSGWCAAWSLYYLFMRAQYPELKPHELMHHLLQNFQRTTLYDMKRFIRNFSNAVLNNVNVFDPAEDEIYKYNQLDYDRDLMYKNDDF